MPLSLVHATLYVLLVFVWGTRDLPAVPSCITESACSNNIQATVISAIHASEKMFGSALKQPGLTDGKLELLDERLCAAIPHWAAAIEAKTGLMIESVSAVSRD